jgi:hypothetical protein
MSKLISLAGGLLVGIDDIDAKLTGVNPFSSIVSNNGYIRTTNNTEQFSNKFYYGIDEEQWLTISSVNSTFTADPNLKVGVLDIGTAADSSIVIQTTRAFLYLAGSTHRYTAGIHYDLENGAILRAGVFDEENGYYFEVSKLNDEFQASVVRRSKTSGVVEEEIIPQSAWNIDKLDGTGESGKTLDLSKVQMLCLEYTWYGAGGAVLGFEIDRNIYFCHWFSAGNRLTSFINSDPDLPIRYELFNNSVTAANSNLYIGGIFLAVDGSLETRLGYSRGYVTPPRNVIGAIPLLSLRTKLNYKGLLNKADVRLSDFELFGTAEGYYSLMYNATVPDGTWVSVGDDSACEYNDTGTSVSGGTTLYAGGVIRISNRGGQSSRSFTTRETIHTASDGSSSSSFTFVFVPDSNGTMGVAFNWREFY